MGFFSIERRKVISTLIFVIAPIGLFILAFFSGALCVDLMGFGGGCSEGIFEKITSGGILIFYGIPILISNELGDLGISNEIILGAILILIALLWTYFLSCVLFWVVDKIKRKKIKTS